MPRKEKTTIRVALFNPEKEVVAFGELSIDVMALHKTLLHEDRVYTYGRYDKVNKTACFYESNTPVYIVTEF